MNVSAIDWVIVGVFFVAALGVAIYMNSLCRGVADYLVAARKVRMWLGIGAGIGAEIGLVSVAAMCEQGFLRGYSFTLLQIMSIALMVPLFGFFGFGIERFRATGCMSVPQYIELRYSRRLRVISGLLNCIAGVIQMTIFPIVGAMFVAMLIRAPETMMLFGHPVRTVLVITAVLLCCNIVFTYLGGAITLTVTNFFMMIIIMGAITWLMLYLVSEVGLQTYWTNLENNLGLSGFYPFTGDQHSYGWLFFAWSSLMAILLQFSYGPYLQKYASMDKPKTVSRSYMLGVLFGSGRLFLIMGFGVATLAALGPNQPADFVMENAGWSQMATPYYLSSHLPPILMGFLLACLLFADTHPPTNTCCRGRPRSSMTASCRTRRSR
jgi:solute:Na+ symporter, SSS family